jgi:hypothetical protein
MSCSARTLPGPTGATGGHGEAGARGGSQPSGLQELNARVLNAIGLPI